MSHIRTADDDAGAPSTRDTDLDGPGTLTRVHPSEFEAAWALTGVTIGDALPSHPTRRVFKVHSDQGVFVAKVDAAPRSDIAYADQLYVLDYLAGRNFGHAPALLRTSAGHRFSSIGNNTLYLLEYIPRAVDDGTQPTDMWRGLGEAAARLNAHGDYSAPFAIPIEGALDELARRAAGWPFEGRFRALLARLTQLTHLPPNALVHGEINCANARRRADGTVVLVDWDQTGTTAAAMEYGYPLVNVFLSEDDLAFDDRSASAFYKSYLDSGGVIEPPHLFSAALFHALRYMWWGDTWQRWERILHAVKREDEICSVLPYLPAVPATPSGLRQARILDNSR